MARVVDKRFAFATEDKGWEADARHWAGRVSREYRMVLLDEGEEKTRETVNEKGERVAQVMRKGMAKEKVAAELDRLVAGRDVALRQMLRWKVRYFTDGVAVGSRAFVDGFFEQNRERFGPKRKSGAQDARQGGGRGGMVVERVGFAGWDWMIPLQTLSLGHPMGLDAMWGRGFSM